MESPSARPHGFFRFFSPPRSRFPFSHLALFCCLVRFHLFPFAALRFLSPSSTPFSLSCPSFFYCSLAVYYILTFFFVFVFCLSFFVFFCYIPPPPLAPMVLNSPHSYIFLPCFMKRIHTKAPIFKENKSAIPHQSKKSVKQMQARGNTSESRRKPTRTSKRSGTQSKKRCTPLPRSGHFLLADQNGKGGFSFAYFTNL